MDGSGTVAQRWPLAARFGVAGVLGALSARAAERDATGATPSAEIRLLQAAADELTGRGGGTVHAVPTDTGDDASMRNLVSRAVEILGGVHILVNNAGNQTVGNPPPDLAGTTDEAFFDDVDIKVVGYLRTARAVAPLLIAQGWGRRGRRCRRVPGIAP